MSNDDDVRVLDEEHQEALEEVDRIAPEAAAVAPKRRGRPPGRRAALAAEREAEKPRPDTRQTLQRAMDGWGNPLRVTGEKGWDYYWVTDEDLTRFARPWVRCLWGKDKVVCQGQTAGEPNTPIKFRELHLYKMRSAQTLQMRENDPNKISHDLLWEQAQTTAREGIGVGPVSREEGRLEFIRRGATL